WFLGLTMLGTPIIFITDLIKGFTIGFTSSLVINGLGAKGILLNLLILFPQNIIYIPAIIILSVIASEFSLRILKNGSHMIMDKSNNWVQIVTYSTTFLLVSAFMFVGFVIEGYISPNMVKIIVSNIGSILP
ncbi:stage II sporulation protein M, partial [Clostridium botulinum]